MTKFEFQGTGQTIGGDGGWIAGLAAAVLIGAVAYESLKGAARTLGDLLVIVPVAAGSLIAGALVTFVLVKARRPRQVTSGDRPAPVLWHANPQAIPPREARAIAPAPVVNINLGDAFAAFLREQAVPAAPVIVQSETQELPR